MKRSSSSDMIPPHLGRFTIRGQLGAGAFGTVHRAYDPQLDREIALKIAHRQRIDQPGMRERFFREARTAARLRHPNIVPVYDAGCEEGRYYIAACLIDGRTLEATLQDVQLDVRTVVRIVQQLASALDYAHRQGIVHRDVKPANVMLDRSGRPYLMDFGLARLQDDVDRVTHDGTILGTPAYMAPEQAAGARGDPLAASDQYSLGVMLYELLCGRLPFSGSVQTVMRQLLHEEPVSPRQIVPKLPHDLETICLKAMAKTPEKRYASCQELADDLRRWLEGEPIRARRLRLGERVVRWVRKEPTLALASLAAGVTFLAAVLIPVVMALLLSATVRQEEAARRLAEEQEQLAETSAAEADAKGLLARQAGERAQAAIKVAQARAKEASVALSRAEKEAAEAQQALDDLQHRRGLLRRYEYTVGIQLAQQALEAGRANEAAEELNNLKPAQGEESLLGFEWGYLQAQVAIPPRRTLGSGSGWIERVALNQNDLFVVRMQEPGTGVKNSWKAAVEQWELQRGVLRQRILLEDLVFGASVPELTRGRRLDRLERFPHLTLVARLRRFLERRFNRSTILRQSEGGAILQVCASGIPVHTDGTWLWFITPSDGRLHVWDFTGKEQSALKLSGEGFPLAFSPNRTRAVVATGETITLFDTSTGKAALELQGARKKPTKAVFDLLGERLAVQVEGGVQLWTLANPREPIHILSGSPECFYLDPRGTVLATLSTPEEGRSNLRLWDCLTGKERALEADAITAPFREVCFSPDGRWLAAGGLDSNRVTLWDLATGRRLVHPLSADGKGPVSITVSEDGAWLFAARTGKAIELISTALIQPPITGQPLRRGAITLAYSGATRTLLVADEAQIQLWRHQDRRPAGAFPALASPVRTVVAAAKSDHLAILHQDGKVTLWTLKDGQPPRELRSFSIVGKTLSALALSEDGKTLALGTHQGGLHLFNSQSGKAEVIVTNAHNGAIAAISLNDDGKRIATAGSDGLVKLWDAESGKELQQFKGHKGAVSAMALSPDAEHVVSVGADRTVRLWDTNQGGFLLLEGHGGGVTQVGFAPDGRTVVTGGMDKVIRLWQTATGQELLTLQGHESPLVSVVFSADRLLLASADATGGLRVWEAAESRK